MRFLPERRLPGDGVLSHHDGLVIPRPAFPLSQQTEKSFQSSAAGTPTSGGSDLPLLAQDDPDGVCGHHDVDLLLLDVLQLEFVL